MINSYADLEIFERGLQPLMATVVNHSVRMGVAAQKMAIDNFW